MSHKQDRSLVVIDAGNGEVKGMRGNSDDVLSFAPIIAPMTDQKQLKSSDDGPGISVRNGGILVFGRNDVEQYGIRERARRLTATTRYTTPDYVCLVEAMLLQLLRDEYNGRRIEPRILMMLPVSVYNDSSVVEYLEDEFRGHRDIRDYYGNLLSLDIHANRFRFIPESAGAVYHHAYHPDTLKLRGKMQGTTLMIDIGFETVNASLFEDFRYIPDGAHTVPRAGMYTVVQEIAAHIHGGNYTALDLTRVDDGLRRVAGKRPGAVKMIEFAPGKKADVAKAYDTVIDEQVALIRDELERRYSTARISRVLIAGGGANHLLKPLKDALLWGDKCKAVPDANHANLLGAMTMLRLKAVGT